MKQAIKGQVGRPKGYRLSAESKAKISVAKTGQHHSEETKKKISAGVLKIHETGAPIEIIMKTDLSECGTFKNSHGYMIVCIPNPTVGDTTYDQMYHVALIEKKLGRKLKRGEQVHHWGEKNDNRLLMITLCHSKAEHIILDKAKVIINQEE